MHVELGPVEQSLLTGLSIMASAFLLSWAAEVAQLDMAQSLAMALLALIAILPEYSVDVIFAWKAAKDPAYAPLAIANMTGANRLLIGVAWPAVVFVYYAASRRRAVELEESHGVEIFYLLICTLYSFVIPLKSELTWVDAVFFGLIFFFYVRAAASSERVEPQLVGPAALMANQSVAVRRVLTYGSFVYAALAILVAAEPFAEGLIHSGKIMGIEEFVLVQWVAPLASEAPEFIVSCLFAYRLLPGMGLGALMSSKVNQWTLLVGLLPIVYSISLGRIGALHLDHRQIHEVLLTSAQSLFAVIALSNFRLHLWEAGVILVLFSAQALITGEAFREIYSMLYIFLSVTLILADRRRRNHLGEVIRRYIGRSVKT